MATCKARVWVWVCGCDWAAIKAAKDATEGEALTGAGTAGKALVMLSGEAASKVDKAAAKIINVAAKAVNTLPVID